jgi:hypothetical protein
MGSASSVDIQIGNIDYDELREKCLVAWENIRSMRTAIPTFPVHGWTDQFLNIFGSTPVTDLVYKWLREDLKRVNWLS